MTQTAAQRLNKAADQLERIGNSLRLTNDLVVATADSGAPTRMSRKFYNLAIKGVADNVGLENATDYYGDTQLCLESISLDGAVRLIKKLWVMAVRAIVGFWIELRNLFKGIFKSVKVNKSRLDKVYKESGKIKNPVTSMDKVSMADNEDIVKTILTNTTDYNLEDYVILSSEQTTAIKRMLFGKVRQDLIDGIVGIDLNKELDKFKHDSPEVVKAAKGVAKTLGGVVGLVPRNALNNDSLNYFNITTAVSSISDYAWSMDEVRYENDVDFGDGTRSAFVFTPKDIEGLVTSMLVYTDRLEKLFAQYEVVMNDFLNMGEMTKECVRQYAETPGDSKSVLIKNTLIDSIRDYLEPFTDKHVPLTDLKVVYAGMYGYNINQAEIKNRGGKLFDEKAYIKVLERDGKKLPNYPSSALKLTKNFDRLDSMEMTRLNPNLDEAVLSLFSQEVAKYVPEGELEAKMQQIVSALFQTTIIPMNSLVGGLISDMTKSYTDLIKDLTVVSEFGVMLNK